jgi:hypothetical protein
VIGRRPSARLAHAVRSARAFCALLLAFTVSSLVAPTAAAQQQADVIRGRVTSPEGAPIPNVQVTAVSFFGGITKQTRTNRDGRFSLTYPNGEGDYWLSFAAIGFQAQRIEIKRVADEEVLLADIKLSNAQVLQAVTTTASTARQPPPRQDFGGDITGGDNRVSNTNLPPEQAGNLAALAASLAGVQFIPGLDGSPDRFSIFGLDPSQNNASLNGQQAGLSTIPRDASVGQSVRTGYDVANGGFSGAQVAITTFSGNNYLNRQMSGVFNAPQAQWNDPVGRASNYAFASVGGRLSGPIVMDKDFYNVSFQFDRRDTRLPTLLSSPPTVFQSNGLAADSAARLRSILGTLGVPIAVSDLGRTSPRTSGSLLGTFDWAPKSPTSGQAFNIAFNGSYSDAGPQNAFALQTPSALNASTNISGGSQLRHTNYFNNGVLTESMVSVSGSHSTIDPFLELPGGSVLVTSRLDDGTTATRSLGFGGATNAGSNDLLSVSGRNMLSWISGNNQHRLKLITELRLDRSASVRAANLFGRYTYQSLDDLAAGIPSSFSRNLNTVSQSGRALVGAVSLGDAWRPSKDVQLQYGVRLDGNAFLDRPEPNAALTSALGTTNTRVPNRLYVSPRLGFSWLMGTAPQIAFADGFFAGPRATIRGGIGLFQNMRGPELVANAIANTGLPSSQQQIVCTGGATPVADWNALLANPGGVATSCADGTGGSLFANGAPSVTTFAQGYAQEQTWRTNLSWNGLVLGNRFTLTANGQYALNLHQPDFLDLNFRPERQFTLGREQGRPVYVAPSSIDPASGLIASRDARLTTTFNAVAEQRSDLRSQSGQLTVNITPFSFNQPTFRWSAGYSYLFITQQYRGFSNTAGDPLAIAWNTGAQPRHDLTYTFTWNVKNFVTLQWNGRLNSGQRFTPMIAGDVNGDGRTNDRAFIFAPGGNTDAALSGAMQTLLASGSPVARRCLQRQLGQLADRNSCEGPWTAGNSNLGITLNPARIRLPQRTTVSFTLSNPLAAADLLLHGEAKLKGWGQPPFIDQSLLFVRGFDRTTNSFRYDVNERFGATRVQQVTSRAPAILTMRVNVDLAPTRDWQNLSQQLARGRTRAGAKMTEPAVRQMSPQLFPNVMSRLLQVGEQIHLTRVQADSLATMSRRYTRLVDSAWTPAAKYLAALPKEYDRAEAQRRLVAARQTVISYLIDAVPNVRKMLTKGQLRVLNAQVLQMLEPRYLELLKSGQSGSEFAVFFF